MKQRVDDICKVGNALFTKRSDFMQLCQELAENFYPERADFTTTHKIGDEFASHLVTSAPVMARRDLANQVQAMLRPRGKNWFNLRPKDEDLARDPEVLHFTKWLTSIQTARMMDPRAKFQRATKQGDNDFITFGQTVISLEPLHEYGSLLYRNWHLRDVAWTENAIGEIDNIHRRWKPTARQLVREFGTKKLHKKVVECVEQAGKDPEQVFNCCHIYMPKDEYDYKSDNTIVRKYVRLVVDVDNEHLIEETTVDNHPYIIPRWQLLSGSQYAYSPSAHYGLPDARTMQAISFTLLKAGEKAADPPMIATSEAIRSDIDIRSGGVTWVDREYDERLGDVLRPMTQDSSGLRFAAEMSQAHIAQIQEAFFLNKINLPPMSGEMTAYEVQVRTQEYIRNALPLFEPLETEYNAPICENTFNTLMELGAFGDPTEWPEALANAELEWQFESPLVDATRKEASAQFMEAANLLGVAAQIDPSLKDEWDYRPHFRESLRGIQAPLVPEEEADEARQAAQEKQAMMEETQAVGATGEAAQSAAAGGAAVNDLVNQVAGEIDEGEGDGEEFNLEDLLGGEGDEEEEAEAA